MSLELSFEEWEIKLSFNKNSIPSVHKNLRYTNSAINLGRTRGNSKNPSYPYFLFEKINT